MCISGPNDLTSISLLLEIGRKPSTEAGDKKGVLIGDAALPPALRPYDVLDPSCEYLEGVDDSFRGLVKAHYDPVQLITKQGRKLSSLQSILRLCHKKP